MNENNALQGDALQGEDLRFSAMFMRCQQLLDKPSVQRGLITNLKDGKGVPHFIIWNESRKRFFITPTVPQENKDIWIFETLAKKLRECDVENSGKE